MSSLRRFASEQSGKSKHGKRRYFKFYFAPRKIGKAADGFQRAGQAQRGGHGSGADSELGPMKAIIPPMFS
jgi:hypothetical protein